jgi:hypothetical protein
MPSPYIPKTYSHFGHRRPLSLPARTPRPPSPIVLAGPYSSPIVAHCPRRRKRPAVPESNSLALPRTSSPIVLLHPVPSSLRTPAAPLASYPSCVTPVRQSSSNKGEVGEVRRSRANHCFHASVFQCPRCIVHLVPRRQRSPKIGDVRYDSVTTHSYQLFLLLVVP